MSLRFKLISSLAGIILLPVIMVAVSGIQMEQESTAHETPNLEIMFFIGILIISFFFCVILLMKFISKDILVPLKQLNEAATHIMNKNLDFEIQHNKKDEMGHFITVFELMRVKLKESLHKQETYEQFRKELISNISHDLRTPITSIRGYVEGLQDGIVHDKDKFERYLAIIKDKTDKLDRLIEDLFEFSQLELGHLKMEFNQQDSKKMLEAIIEPFEWEYRDSSIQLKTARPIPSKLIKADGNRIAQVFENIIGNARKYAGENSEITISANITNDAIRVVIQDDGEGISSEDMPYIFDRFYRGEKSRSREYGGTGLGLAICKQIVEAHGGTIGVYGEPKQGTKFYFTLPVMESDSI